MSVARVVELTPADRVARQPFRNRHLAGLTILRGISCSEELPFIERELRSSRTVHDTRNTQHSYSTGRSRATFADSSRETKNSRVTLYEPSLSHP